TGKSYAEVTPHTFSFNSPEGMCPACQGIGSQYGANLSENSALTEMSAIGLMRRLWGDATTEDAVKYLGIFLDAERIDGWEPLASLPGKKLEMVMNGTPEDRSYKTKEGFEFRWVGINNVLAKMGRGAHSHIREVVVPLLDEHECFSCQGSRLNPLARNVTID